MSAHELDPTRAYDLWADTYDTAPNPMIALSGDVLNQHEPVPHSVLEVGCGTGRNLAALKARGARELAGVDVSEGMLSIARRRLPEATLWCQDARTPVDLEPESLDLVLVSLVLEHLEDPTPIFAEASRLLSKRGTLLVLELHPVAFRAGSRARFEDDNGNKYYTSAWLHTAAELEACALAAGFSPGTIEDVAPGDALLERFPSRRGAGTPWLLKGRWTRAWLAHTRRLAYVNAAGASRRSPGSPQARS